MLAANYAQLRGYQLRLTIAQRNIGIQQDTLDLTRALAGAGQATDRDVAQAEAQLGDAVQDDVGDPASCVGDPVELGEVVQTVVRTAASELRNSAARVDVRRPLWVLGHRGELVDVVLNLVVNAVQARDEGRPNRIAVELYRETSTAVLRVSDTGRGISPAHMKRLFEPFFTTKAPGEGTGLGLSLARKIVLAHGGSIDVTSDLGEGSVFTVRLPAVEIDQVSPAAVPHRESGAA